MMAALSDAHGSDGSILTVDLSESNLSVTKTRHKVKFKWIGEFEELQLFVSTDLKISGTWSYTTNNGGFHTLKAEGV